jgi:hypothetical protein
MNDPIDVLIANGFEIEKTELNADTGQTIYYLIAENKRRFTIIMEEIWKKKY